jgi:8-oxo-dGTP pyrophosphatase MutT (NUDIX family)
MEHRIFQGAATVAQTRWSAGVIVVRKESGQWKFLFLRAYKNWDFPKGAVEPGEDPLEAAVREANEEAGIHDLTFPWGNVHKETEPYRSGGKKVARYYLAATSQSRVTFSVNPEIGKPEHHEYRWLPYEAVRELAPERLLPIIDWANGIIEQG